MAYGEPICACCGATEGVEDHHLYLKSEGCPDTLTVWLCHVCHGAAHGMKRRLNIAAVTKAALQAAKARGVKLGGYRGQPTPDAALGGSKRREMADDFASRVAPMASELRDSGLSLAQIAAELARRGVVTANGGAWTATAVRRVLARAGN